MPLGSRLRSALRWLVPGVALLAGCGDPGWTEWRPLDGAATPDAPVVDAVIEDLPRSDDVPAPDADYALDGREAIDAGDAADGETQDAGDRDRSKAGSRRAPKPAPKDD